ncbi:MAG: hypothetical protein HZA64_02065 [Rhodocyclales bacterium]|nr:hypothetical protein [Rhodocyclales bacterium]
MSNDVPVGGEQTINTPDPLVRKLVRAAWALWLLSLLLPGFVSVGDGVAYGFMILWAGILFGWAVMGWAAYANIFFYRLARRLQSGRPADMSGVLMLALAATLPMFQGVIQNEGSMAASPVASWGWGVILWLISLGFLACAAAIRMAPERRKLWLSLLGVGVSLAAVPAAIVHDIQWRKANVQEREAYLSLGLAFTVQPLCGIDINWPQQPLIDPSEVVAIEVAPDLIDPPKGLPRLWMPSFLAYQEGEFDWRVYSDPVDVTNWSRIRVRTPAVRHRYAISATGNTNVDGAVIQLLDRNANNKVLYEQRLRYVFDDKGQRHFCPFQTYKDWMSVGYDTALLYAIGQSKQRQDTFVFGNAVLDVPCEVGPPTKSGNWMNLRRWDDRDIVVTEADPSIAGLCSANYAAMVYAWNVRPTTGENQLNTVVHLFERSTLKPIALFNNPRPNPPGSNRLPVDSIKSVEIQGDSVTVKTVIGDARATRVAPFTR